MGISKFIFLLGFLTVFFAKPAFALKCPEGTLPVTQPRFNFNNKNYQGLKNISVGPNDTLTLCFKVKDRAEYLMMPYNFIPGSNRLPFFSSSGVDLRRLPVIRPLKGYFKNEIVLIKLSTHIVEPLSCVRYPPSCQKPLIVNVFWRGEAGPSPIETLCPDGFLPPFFNNITQRYTENYYGYRQVPLIPGEPQKFCHFVSQKTKTFEMIIADRTGPDQCGYHLAKFSPPEGSRLKPYITPSSQVGSSSRFKSFDGGLAPRGIWTIEVVATGQIPTCNNKMEIQAH